MEEVRCGRGVAVPERSGDPHRHVDRPPLDTPREVLASDELLARV